MKKFIYFLTALILLFNCRVFGQVTIGEIDAARFKRRSSSGCA